eukprot:975320-Alexandrium_andersonii.AAC.1
MQGGPRGGSPSGRRRKLQLAPRCVATHATLAGVGALSPERIAQDQRSSGRAWRVPFLIRPVTVRYVDWVQLSVDNAAHSV